MVFAALAVTGCAPPKPAGADRDLSGRPAGDRPAAAPAQSSKPQSAGQHYQAARAALLSGNFDKAALEAKLALQEDPRDAAAHFLLGCLLEMRGEHDQATVAFQRAVALEPTNPDALYNLGTLLLRRADFVAAARLLENAVLVRPSHIPSYNNLGKAYFMAGLPELAVAAYEEALRRDPANAVALRNLLALAEAAGLKDAAAAYRRRLETLGKGPADKPAIDAGEPLTLQPTWPLADPAPAAPPPPAAPGASAATADAQPDPEMEALHSLLRELPHVTAQRRAGRLVLAGWTSSPKERVLLDRIIGKSPDGQGRGAAGPGAKPLEVLDLTGDDAGDPHRMVEVDATLFSVSGLDQTDVGFNFLQAVNLNFKYFATDQERTGTGFAAPGSVGAVSGLSQQGWIFGASVDYLVNIANASEQRVAVLARPHLAVLNQTPADFLAGGELVYRVSGVNSGDIRPYPFGTKLTVTPTLLRTPAEDGTPRVHLKVKAGRTSVLSLLDTDPNQPTAFQKVEVSSEAVLSIGQTLILSGLSQRESRSGRSGVPGLRNIPIIRHLFSTQTNMVSDVAVVILLTPRDAAFLDERNLRVLEEFVAERRAFIRASQGGREALQRFHETNPRWGQLAPNRFASHAFMMENSEIYRAVCPQDLAGENVDLELLGPKARHVTRPRW
jgi:Tfp pilus assembly protein PilF